MISAVSNLKIQNKEEFKVLAEKLYDPNIDQNEIAGILDALETRLNESLGQNAPQEAAKTSERQQQESPTVNIRYNGKVKAIPRNEWQALTEAQRQGYEEI